MIEGAALKAEALIISARPDRGDHREPLIRSRLTEPRGLLDEAPAEPSVLGVRLAPLP